jgi:hypothetical protein
VAFSVYGDILPANRYLLAYHAQKSHAAKRGIEFLLTFKEWCDFWGDDVDRRGSGKDDLQMQRFADTGPYQVGNIKKGTPKENMVTAGRMKRKRASEAAHKELQAALDRAMYGADDPDPDDDVDEEIHKLGFRSSYSERYFYKL